MVKNWCMNGTMEDTRNYSSPVPLIGLYTAGATLVCLSLILCDVFAGYRCRKSWYPSRFFALNSVTLSLLAISTKIPVDLTTPMPSAQDQLSKLTGTIFICMSMGFFMPSLGTNRQLECYANLVALSIFLITVAIDVCIQMATGVIFAFIAQHFIVLFCMLVMLVTFWISGFHTNLKKDASIDQIKDFLTKGEGSMFKRLKLCYLYAYDTNPQFELSKNPYCGVACLLCTVCAVVLADVVLESVIIKDSNFCRGVSDYEWSIWMIVVTQILTVSIVSVVMVRRWLIFAGHVNQNVAALRKLPYRRFTHLSYLLTMTQLPEPIIMTVKFLFCLPVYYIHSLVTLLTVPVSSVLNLVTRWMSKDTDEEETGKFKDLLEKHNVFVEEWSLRKGVHSMERWIDMNTSRCRCLTKLLSTTPSQESRTRKLEVSSLRILILVDMAKVSLPTSLAQILSETLEEIFEIVYFIDSQINLSLNQKIKSMYAQIHWMSGNAVKYTIRNFVKRSTYSKLHTASELDRALGMIGEGRNSRYNVVLRDELREIANFILSHSYTSLEELCDCVMDLFVNMLRDLLRKLPEVIYNHIAESPVEEYEERVRLGLRFMCKLEELEDHVGWSFPTGSNISSFIDPQISDVEIC